MRLLIVSNRAPVNVIKDGNNLTYAESSGGLASGLRAYVDKVKKENPEIEIIWLGWPGASVDDEEKVRKEILDQYGTYSVFVPEDVMDNFYEGFCNNTIWPLFHYFPVYTEYHADQWEIYIKVNQIFCDTFLKIYKPGDIIWIHDYHLMLLPAMIRKIVPDATIGFFLHIPFPSYEVFRLLPSEWRLNILKGLYGADLVGFHTHDYRTYFLRSTLRILGLSNNMGEVNYFTRNVKVDSFPMGIDYEKYNSAVDTDEVKKEVQKLRENFGQKRLIMSIDRQDYSKGILNRLKGYESFLKKNPTIRNDVMMVMIVIPSRVGIKDYGAIKSQIDELIGRINGTYGTLSGMPILYQYRSLNFSELIAIYSMCDVGLVTPLRDGMNLVAKEFIACKTNGKGALILSEMAGAAEELGESIIINPNNIEEIGDAIMHALTLDEEDQTKRLAFMQQRIKEYDIFKWAASFLKTLEEEKDKQYRLQAKILPETVRSKIKNHFRRSTSKLILLDYDGTLRPFSKIPSEAHPEKNLIEILDTLNSQDHLQLVLISGRDWQTMDKWFGHLPINMVAEHGLFIKERHKSWRIIKPVRGNWKKKVIEVMKGFTEKLPGALVEEKDYSLAFHYRRSDPELASLRVRELMSYLGSYISNIDVKLMRGNKVIELRSAGIDKGVAAMHWITKLNDPSRFIMAIGDDITDEDLFRVIPSDGYSIRVGRGTSYAMYNLDSSDEVVELLHELNSGN
jgi:trehalose 6-phosphate synthase/phosphatase